MIKLSGDPRQEGVHFDRYAHTILREFTPFRDQLEKLEGETPKALVKLAEHESKETVMEVFHRVAWHSSVDRIPFNLTREEQYGIFLDLFIRDLFTPGGRPLANLGGNWMCFNCFVLPIDDSRQAIMETLRQFVEIASRGGGIGINFSNLRPRGEEVVGTRAIAGGPVSFIDAFQAMAKTIKQGGTRGLACMTILDVSHPDIREFINAKRTDFGRWEHTNISVGISDAFMEAVRKDEDWELKFNGKVYETVSARELYTEICQCAWESGEPGVIFMDTIERANPASYYGKITCTNPCGEQPLFPYGVCDLGSIILPSFWDFEKNDLDWELLQYAVRHGVVWLDNLIDVSSYPLPENEKVAKDLRPVGLGATGWADLLLYAGLPYGDHPETLEFVEKVADFIQHVADNASYDLAQQYGPFPAAKAISAPFQSKYRNATRTSYAPTGTISTYFQCSQGVEPYFALKVKCKEEIGTLVTGNPHLDKYMEDNNMTELPEHVRFSVGGVGIDDKFVLTPEDHVAMLNAFARNCDTAVSKTLNLPASATVGDISRIYQDLWARGIKGGTVFRDGCREGAFESVGEQDSESPLEPADEDFASGLDVELIDTFRKPRKRPKGGLPATVYGVKYNAAQPTLWITITELEGSPFELFFHTNDNNLTELLSALSRSITSSWRRGEPMEHLFIDYCKYKSLNGGMPYKKRDGSTVILQSVQHAIGVVVLDHFETMGLDEEEKVLISPPEPSKGAPDTAEEDVDERVDTQPKNPCPKCGAETVFTEGCRKCSVCPWGRCG